MVTENSVTNFMELLASASPVPGGGGAAALAGVLGAALGSMVGNLTIGKKKYENVQEDIRVLLKKAAKLRKALLALVDEDAEAFEPLSKAYGLPKSTPEEIEKRDKIMETCLRAACVVPEKIMDTILEVIKLHEELMYKGSAIVISDVGVGVTMCRAAISGAALNIYVNTKYMKDRDYAAELNSQADKMLAEGLDRADVVYKIVTEKLRS